MRLIDEEKWRGAGVKRHLSQAQSGTTSERFRNVFLSGFSQKQLVLVASFYCDLELNPSFGATVAPIYRKTKIASINYQLKIWEFMKRFCLYS